MLLATAPNPTTGLTELRRSRLVAALVPRGVGHRFLVEVDHVGGRHDAVSNAVLDDVAVGDFGRVPGHEDDRILPLLNIQHLEAEREVTGARRD